MFQLHVFGGFEFTNDGRSLVGFDATRLQALLTYLVLRRHAPTTRQQIAYALWPDVAETQARSSLRQLFHQLRQLLPEIGHILLIDSIAARWQHDALLQVDVWQFQDAVDKFRDLRHFRFLHPARGHGGCADADT